MVDLNLKTPAYSEEEDQVRHCCLDRPRSKSPERGCRDHGDDGDHGGGGGGDHGDDDGGGGGGGGGGGDHGDDGGGGGCDHGDDGGGGGYHIPLPLHSNGAPLGQGKALRLKDALNVLGHLEKHYQASEVSYQPFPNHHHGKFPPA